MRIIVTSTTWRSRPAPSSVRWSPPTRRQVVYVEEPVLAGELAEQLVVARVTTETSDYVRQALPRSTKFSWGYPPAVDAWNLSDLLHSMAAPLPHGWARAQAPALFVAVDPLGAGSILFARCLERAASIVVITDASQVDLNMVGAIRYADAVVAHSSHRQALHDLRHHHIAFADQPAGFADAVAQAASDLMALAPDPLVAFRTGSPLDEEVAASDDFDVVVSASRSVDLVRRPSAMTFAELIDLNFGDLTVVAARVSMLRRFRTVVERSDDLAFVRLAMAEGYDIDFR